MAGRLRITSIAAATTADATGKTELMADLQLLREMLRCLMDCSAVGFRLKLLQQPMCPRFHTDHVTLRLLVTYAGTGTEWLPQAPAAGSSSSAADQCPASGALKGSAWQGNQQGAILATLARRHRTVIAEFRSCGRLAWVCLCARCVRL